MKKVLKSLVFLWVSTAMLMSCSTDDDNIDDPILQLEEPVLLDCNYFMENRVLTNNPNAAVDYIISCKMKVEGEIIVEPGVVIEFQRDAGIEVENTTGASFLARGTEEKPIVMRGTQGNKGFWAGLMFNNANPKNELNHVQIIGAGGDKFNSNGDQGAIIVWAAARLKLKNSIISNSETFGLNAGYNDAVLEIEDNLFTNNNIPVKINPNYLNYINSSNDYSGNTMDFVYVESGSIDNDANWRKINVPYVVMNSSTYGFSKGIDIYKVLRIEPGVKIEFESGTHLKLVDDPSGIVAVGSSSDPIIFTGVNKVPNGWVGIYFNSANPLNEIGYAQFHYSGKTTGSFDYQSGTIRVWYDNLLNIHDVTFSNITGCAINRGLFYGQTENVLLTYNDITVEEGACLIGCFGQGC